MDRNKHDSSDPDGPQSRLATIERRIARMRALNETQGDVFALRMIAYAETERREILGLISAEERKRA